MNVQISDTVLTMYEDYLMAIFSVGVELDTVIKGKNCFLQVLRPDCELFDINWSRRVVPASSLLDNSVELCVKRPTCPLR